MSDPFLTALAWSRHLALDHDQPSVVLWGRKLDRQVFVMPGLGKLRQESF